MADKEWSAPPDIASARGGGMFVNETVAGDVEWLSITGSYVNEAAAPAAGVGVLVIGSTEHILGGFVVT